MMIPFQYAKGTPAGLVTLILLEVKFHSILWQSMQ